MKRNYTLFIAFFLIAMLMTTIGLAQKSTSLFTKPNVAYPHSDVALQKIIQAPPDVLTNSIQPKTSILSSTSASLAGGNRLVEKQYTDGGWGWPLNAPPTYGNILGPIAMGLAQAYQQTGEATQRTALTNAGAFLLTKTNNFSPSDGYLAAQLDKIFGGTTYRSHVKTNFYDQLAAGTYNRNGAGTLYSTEAYVNLIRTSRASQGIGNMAAWDIGVGLVGAAMCEESTSEWIAGVKGEIDELDGDAYYDVIGLAGALYGLAFVEESFDPTTGEHAAASNMNDLAAILASYQISGGGFAWNSNYVIPNDGNETIQETGYSILALNEINRETYLANILGAADYMMGVQLGTGGWENYPTDGENNEVTGEALWGISAAYPAPVHNITKDVYYPTIQGAVNDASSGDEIVAEEGTYVEQVNIATNLTLTGEGTETIIKSPATLTSYTIGGTARRPIVYVHNANVTLQQLMVDGDGLGNANGQFMGIAYQNASGTIDNVTVTKVRNTPHDGAQYGVGIYGRNEDAVSRTLNVTNCTVTEFQKNGLTFVGAGLTVNVNNNTVTGVGGTTVTAQNGIQVSSGASGVVGPNNSVSGVSYVGPTWTASGILVYYHDNVDVQGNTITNNQTNVYMYEGNGTISGNTISATSTGTGQSTFYGILVGDPEQAKPSPFDNEEASSKIYKTSLTTTATIAVNANTITSELSGGVDHIGLYAFAGYFGAMNIAFSASNNIFSGWVYGAYVDQCASGCTGGTFTSATMTNNSFDGNTTSLVSSITAFTLDASANWFGDATESGVVSKLSGTIDYTPWFNSATDVGDPGFQGDYSVLNVSATSPQVGTTMRIQEGINLVSGSTVNLSNGTYNEIISVNKANLTIIGNIADPSQVVINSGGLGGYGSPLTAIWVPVSGVSLKGFTHVGAGQTNSSNPRYAIKFSGNFNGATVEDVVIHDFYRAGLEFHTGSNVSVTDVSAYNNGGTGFVVRNVNGANLTNISTNNNTWGGVRVQTDPAFVTDNIVFAGTNSFGENNQRNGGLYTEEDPAGNPPTYGYDGSYNIQLQQADFEFALLGTQDDAKPRVRFYKTLSQAGTAAIGTPAPDHLIQTAAYIRNLVDGELYVEPGMKVQAAVNGANTINDVINVASGTFNETVTFASSFGKSNLTISGNETTRPTVNGGLLFQNTGTLNGMNLANLYFTGDAGSNRLFMMNAVTGAVNNLSINNCVFDGENVADRMGIPGNKLGQTFSVTNSEFKNILGWAVLDMDASSDYNPIGGNGLPLTTVTFANNNVHNCNGSVALRGHYTSQTTNVNVYGNTFQSIGGNQSQAGEQWAAMEINHVVTATIHDNTINQVSLGVYGEGEAFQFWDIGTLDMYNNTLTNNYQGIFFFGGGVGNSYGGPYALPAGSMYHNTFSGNSQYNVSTDAGATGGPLNAESNYWGTIVPAGVAATISGNVDYDPWCNSDFTVCTLTPTIADAYVDDDWVGTPVGTDPDGVGPAMAFGYDAFATVQEGINAVNASTVHVAAGVYEEQLEITKELTLIGAGVGSTIIKSPTALTLYFTTSSNNFPIVYVHGIDGVTIQNLTVDGAGRGNSNYRFQGIAFYNASGTVSDCEVKDVRNTPIDGSQHGVGIYAWTDTPTLRTVTVTNSTVYGFQKNGMALNGSSLTANVSGNTVTGAGAINFMAQNGIQIGFGATGSITNNTVSGVSYTPSTWVSTGILLYDDVGLITTSNNIVNESQIGIYYINVGGTISNNTVNATLAGVGTTYFWGIVADPGATPKIKPSAFDEELSTNLKTRKTSGLTTISTLIEGNSLLGDGTNGTALELDALGTETLNINATDNAITGWAYGVYFYKDAGATLNGVVNNNKISGNVVGAYDQTGILHDAKNNWWGHATGPLDTKTLPGTPNYNNTDGLGNSVNSYVDYNPFYIDEAMTTLSTISISGMKFNDLNGNGVKDANDAGLAGWTINLAGSATSSATTDVNGNYSFNNLEPGTYTVSEVLQAGWLQTTQAPTPFTLDPGDNVTDADFGNFRLIDISGLKFNDHDGDGVKDENDEGLAGWTINLAGTATASATTDANGAYSFTNLGPGTFTVTETVLDGWVQTTTNPASITSSSGTNVSDADFGNFQKFTISGLKFDDTDGDGVKDASETGLSNWTINLTGAATASTTTDVQGIYSFANLGPGTYTVREALQTGWVQSTTNPSNVVGSSGVNVSNINFGNFKIAYVTGMKYNDFDGDGVKDAGDVGLPGWTIRATKGASTKNATSDANGNYSLSFTNTDVGLWTISEVLQTSWRQTYPTAGTYSVTIQSGTNAIDKTFGNYQLSTISGQKFNDLQGDSAVTSDQPMNNWVIKLYSNNQLLSRKVTTGSGNYSFTDLTPGTYVVQESLQTNWIQTYPKAGAGIVTPFTDANAGPRAYQFVLTSGTTLTGKHFGNFSLGIISGVKFEDIDGDSVKEEGDPLLQSWVVNLKKNGNIIETDTTDGTGNYGFDSLTVGTYEVCEELQPDWYQTLPATPCYTFNVVSGSNFTGNIGNFEFGSIAGYKFFDHDSDGVRDLYNDDLMDSLKVILIGTHTAPETVMTDANGAYVFDPVPADVYTIKEIPRSEWRQTKPANGANYTVQMFSNLDTNGFAFGNFYQPDTIKFRTFSIGDYNKAAAAKGRSKFIKKPNAGNVRDSVYLNLGFGLETPLDSGYLRIGIQRYDSANFYGWFHYAYYKYRKGNFVGYHQASVAKFIYNLRLWKPSKQQPKTNYILFTGEKTAPTYFGNSGNHFTVELTGLKTNVAASDLGITPRGLGDLVFDKESGADTIFNGKTIREIIAFSDSALTLGLRDQAKYPLSYLIMLDTIVTRINREFLRPFGVGYTFISDTVSTSPLVVKGYKSLYKVNYLKRDPSRVTMLTRFAPTIAENDVPSQFRLEQNYPNPFNPMTTIEFELEQPSYVSLKIFNVLGQEVATLFDQQEMSEGMQAIEFDATNFASGVYFYKLEAKEIDSDVNMFISVKKMMLVK